MALLLARVLVPLLSAQTRDQTQLLIAPAKADFGAQPLDFTSQPVDVTIKNPSGHPISLEEIISSGLDFSIQNGCTQQLAPGAECSVKVRFKPAITGSRTGILEIVAGGAANPCFVPLSGTGVSSEGPEGTGAASSRSSLNRHEDISPKEKR